MKYNNAFNYIASQRDSISSTDRYLRDTARDEALIRSYGMQTSNSYGNYRSDTAQKACTSLDVIKSNHIRNLNNKILNSLREVLSDEDIQRLQNKDIPIMSPSVLGNNSIMKRIEQDPTNPIAEYNKIISAVSDPIDAQKQSLLQLSQTDYGSAQHVEAQKSLFEQEFRVSDYFDYIDDKCQAPICKAKIEQLAEALSEAYDHIQALFEQDNDLPARKESDDAASNGKDIPAQPGQKDAAIDANQSIEKEVQLQELLDNNNDLALHPEIRKEIEAGIRNLPQFSQSPIGSSTSSETKKELQQQIDSIKEQLAGYDKQFAQLHSKLVNSFNEGVNSKLDDYYKGFIAEFSEAFISAQTIQAGQVKTEGSKSLVIKITSQLANFIPIAGGVVSGAIQNGADYKVGVELQRVCSNMVDFGVTTTYLDKCAKHLAKTIMLDENMQTLIEKYIPTDKKGIFNKLAKLANGLKNKFDRQLDKFNAGELSAQELLGQKQAGLILSEYIFSGKFKSEPKELRLENIASKFIESTLSEIEDQPEAPSQPEPAEEVIDTSSKTKAKESVAPFEEEEELTPRKKAMMEQMAQMKSMFEAMLEQRDNEIAQLKDKPNDNTELAKHIEKLIEANESKIKDVENREVLKDDKIVVLQKESKEA